MLFRYKLPMGNGQDVSKIVNGTLIYSYKWVYSKKDLDLPGVNKESGMNMREFESRDKSDKIERIRAVHVTTPSEESPEEVILEPTLVSEPVKVNLAYMNKPQLIDFLISKGFVEAEYKGKLKAVLLELAEMSQEVGNDDI